MKSKALTHLPLSHWTLDLVFIPGLVSLSSDRHQPHQWQVVSQCSVVFLLNLLPLVLVLMSFFLFQFSSLAFHLNFIHITDTWRLNLFILLFVNPSILFLPT